MTGLDNSSPFHYPNAPPQDATIAVMGPTGTGKSSFIRLATGNELVVVGHSLESETRKINCAEYFNLDGRKVTLVDTPAFDDSREDISDVDILQMIGEYLTKEFYDGKKLSGVIYTHNIANTRMGGVSRRNLKMFKNLVGSDSLQNVLIVTTMWGSVEKAVGGRREEELKSRDTLFKPLIDAGARVVRHDLGSDSAKRIIDTLLGKMPKELLIQTELSNGVSLAETSAGAELSADLDHFAERDEKKLRDLEQELNDAIEDEDMELVEELNKELAKLKRRIKNREEDKEKLTTTYGIRGMGPVMGVLFEHHAVGMKREGNVVGVLEETEIATRIFGLVDITERQRRECGARGKYFRTLRVAMGATVALTVNASARARVWNILGRIFDTLVQFLIATLRIVGLNV